VGVRVSAYPYGVEHDELELYEILSVMHFGDEISVRMLAEPDRARRVIYYAVNAPGVKVPRAYAITLFQQGFDPPES
jgi:hypothetical protein